MIAALLLACAANVAPVTLNAVVAVESRFDELAILDNDTRRSYHTNNLDEAIATARRLVRHGHRVDMGLIKVDSVNLPALGLSIDEIFEPCSNIRAGGMILTANYAMALRTHPPGQEALQVALSRYNTGNDWRGFWNGYVARYYGSHTHVPAIAVAVHRTEHARAVPPKRPAWTGAMFARLSAPTTISIPAD